ncbi:MAG: YraN family protein [Candidatus Saccharimonadales bacterium]
MQTTTIGRLAEDAVVDFLQNSDYDIIARNWKTRTCEVDIIAYKKQRLHFVEVKYRSRLGQGIGFDYIDTRKLRRMEYAAQLWVCKHNWYGEYVLSGASVVGIDYEVSFIAQI